MIIKIIFSDNTLSVIESHDHSMQKSLKKARNDDEANEVFERYSGHYVICDESDAGHASAVVDLRNKKGSSDKHKSRDYDKYR